MTTKPISFTQNGEKLRDAYYFVEGYMKGSQNDIDVDGGALSYVLTWTNCDLQNFLPYLAEKKQYNALLQLCAKEFEWKTWITDSSLELIEEGLNACPEAYKYFIYGKGPITYRNGLNKLLEQMYAYCAPHYKNGVLHYIPERHRANKEVVLTLVKHSPHFIEGIADDEDFLKQCVAANAEVLEHKTSAVRGKIVLMRELVRINPECAKYALSPITTNAGVKKGDTAEERQRKVYEWLTATGERKDMKKAGVLLAVKPSAAAPKKVHKI